MTSITSDISCIYTMDEPCSKCGKFPTEHSPNELLWHFGLEYFEWFIKKFTTEVVS